MISGWIGQSERQLELRWPFVRRRKYEILREEHAALAAQAIESICDNRALREHLSSIIQEGAEHTKELYARIGELEKVLMRHKILFN